jgi:chloramphenicol O-acetyltransferase type A
LRRIDLTTWPRASTYRLYKDMGAPHLGITADVDMTALLETCQREQTSLFARTMHALVSAANQIPALRQRMRVEDGSDRVVEHEVVDPAFTVGVEGGLFNFATVPMTDDPGTFDEAVAKASAKQRHNDILEPFEGVRDDVLYLSCLPWVHFRSMTHPVHTDRPDSVPRIAWGRYRLEGGIATLPVNIQVHHALVDGSHLGAFFEGVQATLTSYAVPRAHGD